MRKLWLILKREYLARVRTKGFVIGTIALPGLTIAYFAFIFAVAEGHQDRPLKIGIVDESGGLATSVIRNLDDKLPNGQAAFEVKQTLETHGEEGSSLTRLLSEVRSGQLDAYLVIPRDALEGKAGEFHIRNPGDIALVGAIRRAVSDAVIARRLDEHGIHVSNLKELVRGSDIKLVKVTKQGETEEQGQTLVISLVGAIVLYMTLLLYGVSTMRSVLEEKTTRIIEMLVSSASPAYLLGGKILGVAAVGLTQYLIWTVSAGLVAGYSGAMARAFRPQTEMPEVHIPTALLVYLVVFFLEGYFLYASLYAAVGAMVSNEQDAQQAQLPVTLPIIASIVLFNLVFRDPNSTSSVVLSLIPFFAPILMLFRIALQTPPFWQIALSLVLLFLTTICVVFVAGKIYRVGILMYGKRPSLVELFRWLRYT
jgi:ABC-2 type transport system permease protein